MHLDSGNGNDDCKSQSEMHPFQIAIRKHVFLLNRNSHRRVEIEIVPFQIESEFNFRILLACNSEFRITEFKQKWF